MARIIVAAVGGGLAVAILVASAFVIGFVVGRGTSEQPAQVADSRFEEGAEETQGQNTSEQETSSPERTSSGNDIRLEGPGDKATPPTFLAKGKLVAELTHDVPEGTPDDLGHFSENSLVVSIRNPEGKIVPGGHIWEVGDYSGSRSVTIPEDGYYTIEVEGESPWSMDATPYPDGA